MTKSDSSFLSALEGRKRQIAIELLRQSPDMTLAELNQLSRGELGKLFATISVSDLLNPEQQRDVAPAKAAAPAAKQQKQKGRGGRRGGAGGNKVAKSSAAEKPARGADKGDKAEKPEGKGGEKAAKPAKADRPAEEGGAQHEVNTRTPAGREAFDKAVYDALKAIGGYAGAGEIQKRVGGTNMQVRSAVNRLIEAGQVNWTGQARGTRYRVA